MSAAFYLVVIFVGVGVGLSDSATVQKSDLESLIISEESIESLASSRILMDHTSPLSLSLPSLPSSQILKDSSLSLSSSKFLKPGMSSVNSDEESVSKTGSEQGDDVKEKDVVSPLHVAQCRATCLEKVCTLI